jgi:hypothetical protein
MFNILGSIPRTAERKEGRKEPKKIYRESRS